MPPRAAATRKRKYSDQNPQPTGNANNAYTACNLPPSSLPPAVGPASVPASDVQPINQHAWPTSYPGAYPVVTSALPSPSLTNEASPTFVNPQNGVYGQPNTTIAETTVVHHPAPETPPGQPWNDQTGQFTQQISTQQPHQPDTLRTPLHIAMLDALTIVTNRFHQFTNGPLTTEERSRYNQLYTACINVDLFFLLIHQYYNCWMIYKTAIHARFHLSPYAIDAAFDQLRVVFRDEEEITPPHRLWFSKYPGMNENVYCVSQVHHKIERFIHIFAVRWPEMVAITQAQQVPLTDCQIREQLQCTSPTIAYKLFTYSRRAIGVPDVPCFANDFSRLFTIDQRMERMFQELKEPVADVAEAREAMVDNYKSIVQRVQQQIQDAAQAAPPAGHPYMYQSVPAQPPTNNSHNNGDDNTAQQQQQQQNLVHPSQVHPYQPQFHPYPHPHPQLQPQPQPQPHPHTDPPPASQQVHQQVHQQVPQQDISHQQISHQQIPHQQLPQPVSMSQPSSGPAAGPPAQPESSSPNQPPPSSGLRYPTGADDFRRNSNPLTVPMPPGQPVQGHLALLPAINLPLQNGSQPMMPQQPPGPWQNQQPSPNHDPRAMQHRRHSAQAPSPPPPVPQEPPSQMQGSGHQQNPHPQVVPSNGPALFSSPQYQQSIQPVHAPQASPSQAPQAPQGFHISQVPQMSRGPQMSQELQAVMVPQALLHQGPAQQMQAPQSHHVQPQLQPGPQNSAAQWSHASTSNQPRPHFTTNVTPPTEYPSSPHDWTSVQACLHLTHLRSPRRAPSSLGPDSGKNRYYQFFSKFVVEPKEIKPHMGVSVLEFDLAQEDLDSLPNTSPPPDPPVGELPTEVPVSRYSNHSHRYRFRLCEIYDLGDLDATRWTLRPTYWPRHIFISVNDKVHHPRLRQHYHHDLPIELTNSVVKGKNIIKVNLPNFYQNIHRGAVYFVAVELVVTMNHKSVCALVSTAPHISVDETKSKIKRRLQLDTDEIIIKSDALTVTVADSFSSKLFDIPVRGRKCRHLECIDLENWLNSRPCKPSREAGEPTLVDAWTCPICGEDARPDNLQVDDFFVEIKDKILKEGMGNVKKIEIVADGTWKAVEEADENATSDKDAVQQEPSNQEATGETAAKRRKGNTSTILKDEQD